MKNKKKKQIKEALISFVKGIDNVSHETDGLYFVSNGYHYKLSNDGTLSEIGPVIDSDESKEDLS